MKPHLQHPSFLRSRPLVFPGVNPGSYPPEVFFSKTPEKRNGWKLEDYFPFGMVHFQGLCLLNFQGVVGIC